MVDRVETQLAGKAEVIRLNLLSEVGRQAAARYGVRGVPTMLIIDSQGQLVDGHYGIPMPSQIVAKVDTLITTN